MVQMRTVFDPETKVWTAPTKPYIFGKQTIGEIVFDKLDLNADAAFEVSHDTGHIITRREMKQMSVNIAQNYLELGVKSEDTVVLFLENREYSAALIIGATYIAAPFCTLELNMDRQTTRNLLYSLQPRVIVCEDYELEKIQSVVAELNLKHCHVFVAKEDVPNSVTELLKDKADVGSFKPVPVEDIEDKVACIVSSSATTGTYKLISLSNPMLLHNYTSDFGPITTVFTFSTLNWISAIAFIVGTCVLEQMRRINTLRDFSPELLLEIIEKHEVNLLILQPDRLNATLRCPKIETTDFSSLYVVMVTGKPLSAHMKAKFEEYLIAGGIVTTYGMTEMAGTITSSLNSSEREGSCGILVENYRAKIVADTGERVGPHKVGEIHVYGEFKFLGYFNNPKLTADSIDEEGYLKTGDIGYFDEDGELYIVDRKKEIIVVGKHFVFPSVLEAIITQCPGVYDCCIIDLPHPDYAFVPVAAVLRVEGSKVTEQEIVDFVAERQPPELQLKGGVVFCDDLPKTTSGKFKRYVIREIVHKKLQHNKEVISRS